MNTVPVIQVIDEKCVNCHQCIAVCPVKICQNGSGTSVTINHDLCIGCGSCIAACTHEARQGLDDWPTFMADAKAGVRTVAIVAPSAAASFGDNQLNLNGFLSRLGVEAFFDVSFGAELTVHSYLKHVQENSPRMVIAQPCPAVVSYLELFQPELLPYLAPADSPMLHSIKLIRTWYPQFKGHRIAVISPCLAKKREFAVTGLGDYNLTFASIEKALDEGTVPLSSYPKIEFEGPQAERAALFSTPGGLLATLRREAPEVADRVRKIEGPEVLYQYLRELPESLKQNKAPFLIDCLNCEKGCNGGTGTTRQHVAVDALEAAVADRALALKKRYSPALKASQARKKLRKLLNRHWRPGLYRRTYRDQSSQNVLSTPSNRQLEELYRKLLKFEPRDFSHCSACGYNSCQKMAEAIHNGLNKVENCHHYQNARITAAKNSSQSIAQRLHERIDGANQLMNQLTGILEQTLKSTSGQSLSISESTAAVGQVLSSIHSVNELVQERYEMLLTLQSETGRGIQAFEQTVSSVQRVFSSVQKIEEVNATVDSVASSTNLLAMNAAIEAAHAGDVGKGFAVVADEIRKLAEQTAANARIIATDLREVTRDVATTQEVSVGAGTRMEGIVERLDVVSKGFQELALTMKEMSAGTSQIQVTLGSLKAGSQSVDTAMGEIALVLNQVDSFYRDLHNLSEENARLL